MAVQIEMPPGSSPGAEDRITIKVNGWDRVLTLESKMHIPLRNIESINYAERTILEDRRRLGMSRAVGVRFGTRYIAGSFVEWSREKVVFWNIHNKDAALCGNVIVIALKNERYNELVLEVDDSETMLAELRRVCGHDGNDTDDDSDA